MMMRTVPDGKGQGQPACQKEWKKYKEYKVSSFHRFKINHDSHEFILESGTVANMDNKDTGVGVYVDHADDDVGVGVGVSVSVIVDDGGCEVDNDGVDGSEAGGSEAGDGGGDMVIAAGGNSGGIAMAVRKGRIVIEYERGPSSTIKLQDGHYGHSAAGAAGCCQSFCIDPRPDIWR